MSNILECKTAADITAAIKQDPLGSMFAIWDAEDAEDAAAADERLYESLFGKVKRDSPPPKPRPPYSASQAGSRDCGRRMAGLIRRRRRSLRRWLWPRKRDR